MDCRVGPHPELVEGRLLAKTTLVLRAKVSIPSLLILSLLILSLLILSLSKDEG